MKTTAAICTHARLLERRFWLDYVTTMRPYLLFVSGITGIAGMSFVSGIPLVAGLLVGSILFLAYGFGQALTDCFQTDTDRLSAPYRPLVRGRVLPRDVLLVSGVGLTVGAVGLTWFHAFNAIVGTLAIVGVATYTWFKRRWWAGPWYNAWIVSLLALMGYLAAAGAAEAPTGCPPGLAWTMAAALAAYANFVLTGYFKDIAADAATGYETLPVRFGRAPSTAVSHGLATLALVAAAAAHPASAWPLLLPAAVVSLYAQVRLTRVARDAEAHRAVAPVVHSYILLLAGLSVANRPDWLLPLAGFYAAFVLAMRARPAQAQV